jgi:hypothetical protein
MQRGDRFESIDAAYEAVKAFVLDQGESFLTVASDKKRYIIRCKDRPCNFRIWASVGTIPEAGRCWYYTPTIDTKAGQYSYYTLNHRYRGRSV